MINIQLPTGNTMVISSYEFYFMLKDEDMDLFYQACIADDAGTYIDNPFSNRASRGKIEYEETGTPEDIEEE